MERISKWKFDKKIQLLVTVSIIVTTLIVLVVSTVSTVNSMKKQSIELLQAQNSTTAENFRNSLDNYKKLAIATVLDSSIQQYLKENDPVESVEYAKNANNMLSSILNMHSNLNFIGIVGNRQNYLYKGEQTIYKSNFLRVYSLDSKRCKTVNASTIKMSYNNAYFNGKQYSLNIYFPIYDTNQIMRELGFLCINFNDPSAADTGIQRFGESGYDGNRYRWHDYFLKRYRVNW